MQPMNPVREALTGLLARQRYDEALVLLAAALRAQPGEPRLLTNLAGVLGLAGRAADGLRAATKAVVLAPDAAAAYAARGRLLLSLHQEQPA
ncbi:MAG: hypothetical protein K2Q10_02955, partial [Rhodospirillales bacterium]|nr:hypothetical protein [Rhodospirillales bacterium]